MEWVAITCSHLLRDFYVNWEKRAPKCYFCHAIYIYFKNNFFKNKNLAPKSVSAPAPNPIESSPRLKISAVKVWNTLRKKKIAFWDGGSMFIWHARTCTSIANNCFSCDLFFFGSNLLPDLPSKHVLPNILPNAAWAV